MLLLCIEKASAYVPLMDRGIRDFQLPRTHSVQRSSYITNINAYSRTRRRHRRAGPVENRYRNNSVAIVLASSFSSDDNQNDEFEPRTNIGGLKEDSTRIQHSFEKNNNEGSDAPSTFQRIFDEIPFVHLFFSEGRKKLPPLQVEDFGVMLYDIFLIVNLSVSISFWVTHRLDLTYVAYAFNEGCFFSILWIAAGLYHGSFLYSAMDGHYPLDDEQNRGGPSAAAALAFNTYINAINLRLVAALVGAWIQHRKVGEGSPMEELIPLEIGCGLVLMTMWRALHSQVTPRVR
jgi:hypothetical protein